MKKFKVVFKEDRDDLEVKADYYESSSPGEQIYFIGFYEKKDNKDEIVSTLSADSVLYITECPK